MKRAGLRLSACSCSWSGLRSCLGRGAGQAWEVILLQRALGSVLPCVVHRGACTALGTWAELVCEPTPTKLSPGGCCALQVAGPQPLMSSPCTV